MIMIAKSVLQSLLKFFSYNHPKEGILLLHGKNKKKEIIINEIVIPPQSVHGEDFSSFPMFMLPIDITMIGTAHSHPSGVLRMSSEDYNNFYGKIIETTHDTKIMKDGKQLVIGSCGFIPSGYEVK